MGTRGATRPGPCGRSAFLVLTAEVLGFHLPRKVRLRCQLRTLFFQHLSVVVSACHLSTWEVEAKRLGIQVHPQLHSEFRASLADMKPYLKGEKKRLRQILTMYPKLASNLRSYCLSLRSGVSGVDYHNIL